jgi:hypothetical protein
MIDCLDFIGGFVHWLELKQKPLLLHALKFQAPIESANGKHRAPLCPAILEETPTKIVDDPSVFNSGQFFALDSGKKMLTT